MTLPDHLNDFGRRYAEAWSSQRAENVAMFFAREGSLALNEGEPAVGRAAISVMAQEFMTAFPDLNVECDRMAYVGDELRWYWTMRGTNTGPGGTGNAIAISGFEALVLDSNSMIVAAHGHFDEAAYQRQLDRG